MFRTTESKSETGRITSALASDYDSSYIQDGKQSVSQMLLVDELLMEWVETVLKKGVRGLREEFLQLLQKKEYYIQGSTINTVSDFWYMIYQQKTEFIIMLTNFNKNEPEKSASHSPVESGQLCINNDIGLHCRTCERRMDFPSEIWQKTIEIFLDETIHFVTIFHWTDWPAHGVPRDFISPLRLLEEAKFISLNNKNFLKSNTHI
ncbi:unnamed protein product [Thelazia callipaeda]|uniref:Tyrosine-protein phosphatase domain-containing protein n=1 Tax=Thelazia callipaeda TaxID=103827 RepID=A0A3P7L9U6_THECL|nr:unnamed protein product [Thelazia callipaeda]